MTETGTASGAPPTKPKAPRGVYVHTTLDRLLDTVHFAPSHRSRMLQAADMLALTYRRYRTRHRVHTRSSARCRCVSKVSRWRILRGGRGGVTATEGQGDPPAVTVEMQRRRHDRGGALCACGTLRGSPTAPNSSKPFRKHLPTDGEPTTRGLGIRHRLTQPAALPQCS
ncbi:MAG: DUF3800 domain-containing protein [Nocardioides sp.]